MLNLYCDPKDSAKNQQPAAGALNDPDACEERSVELEEKLKLYSVVHKEPKEYCRPYKGKYERRCVLREIFPRFCAYVESFSVEVLRKKIFPQGWSLHFLYLEFSTAVCSLNSAR